MQTERAVILLFLCIQFVGCDTAETKTKTADSIAESLMVNRNEPADYRSVSNGFTAISNDLAIRRLTVPSEGTNSGIKFTKITHSGINFSNFLDRSKAFQYIETGSGVTIGDYDGDGLQDVYLCGTDIPNRLYRNLGGFKFEDVTFEAGVDGSIQRQDPWSSGASFADIDNDGDLDLYVCNMAAPNLLYINQGDGSFKEQTRIRKADYTGASKIANFGDYDRDGDLDFYLVTYQDAPSTVRKMVARKNGKPYIAPEFLEHVALVDGHQIKAGELDRLYQNQGDGTFVEVSEAAGLKDYAMGLGALWFDYDDDGWPDIYVSNDFRKSDRLYRNQGDGTFVDVLPETVRHTPWFSMGLDMGDINNDGLVDLITADMSGTSHYKQKMDMGAMSDSAWFLKRGSPRQYMKNAVHINSGVGPFFEVAEMMGMSSTDWTWAIRLVDMDNDGKLDVFASNGHARDIMNSDLGDQFDALKEEGSTEKWDALYLSIPAREEPNLAFRNEGDLSFKPVSESSGLNHVGVSHGSAFGDLDGDGDLDLIVSNFYEPALVYRNDSDSGSRTLIDFRCGRNNFFGYGTKVEFWQGGLKQTKVLSPVRGYISADAPVLHFASESSAPIEKVKVTWPDSTVQEFKDLDPDCHYRIFESETSIAAPAEPYSKPLFVEVSGELQIDFRHRENDFDDFAREPLLPFQPSRLGSAVAWADVNDDGFADLFCTGAAGQSGQLYMNVGGTNFVKADGPWSVDDQFEDMAVLFFDADSDGDPDLLVTSGGNEHSPGSAEYQDRLYRNLGEGKFERDLDALPRLSDSTRAVTAGDFDNDGDLDLFLGSYAIPGQYPVATASHLLRNDDGKFVETTSQMGDAFSSPRLVTHASCTDIDGDGWMDLVLALEWGAVTVFRNEEGKGFSDQTSELGLSDFKGWWNHILATDFDGDGDVDLIAANQGLNTKYHADSKHPHRIYFADFDENGTLDLVESKFEGDVELPVRGRSCSTHCMPFLEDKFKTYHDFAIASLADIYEPSISQQPFVEVNSLESAIFINDEGRFIRQSLPRLAQISPANGTVVADFDGDGVDDMAIANNFFASQVETGFMDGGLGWILRGESKEAGIQFSCMWPQSSGVVVEGPATCVAAADFDNDGDVDLAFAVNDGKVRIFENRTVD
ncbi:VCBS repeat-containing protein [Mariniblastus fucicola]|uniref:FG-GAP repeat protein n=1 Tax=Mariniblastus fucicola TaxID=980251 RepID=A0A5B9PF09_9BACT|nr:VCBS repeat-containing protein [Mariniblastus fucicola]QEG23760.1 FG-GAP repeat protein [Mariniblastus fucicola]